MSHWPDIYDRFSCLRPELLLDRQCCQAIQRGPFLQPVVVACSGGADSVFLCLSLKLIAGAVGRPLVLAHFNHGLRGQEADADESFVAQLAAQLGLAYARGRAEASIAPKEAELRNARYAWLVQVCRDHDAAGLALGHHGDDLVESALMALFSGAGPGGMASPAPMQRFSDGVLRLRPLLSVHRQQITQLLAHVGANWREDPSNQDSRFTRNRVRLEILPRLQACFPQDIYASVHRTRNLMAEAAAALDALIPADLDLSNPFALELTAIHKVLERNKMMPDSGVSFPLPGAALCRRVLIAWWLRHRPLDMFPTAALDCLVESIARGDRLFSVSIGAISTSSYSRMIYALRCHSDGYLRLEPETFTPTPSFGHPVRWLPLSGPLYLPDGAHLKAEWVGLDRAEIGESIEERDRLFEERDRLLSGNPSPGVPYARAEPEREAWLRFPVGPLSVGPWVAGDRYQPLGAPGRRKLQDLFTDAKISAERKVSLPVIKDVAGAILWVPGFPPAESSRLSLLDKAALKLTYHQPSTAFDHKYVG